MNKDLALKRYKLIFLFCLLKICSCQDKGYRVQVGAGAGGWGWGGGVARGWEV